MGDGDVGEAVGEVVGEAVGEVVEGFGNEWSGEKKVEKR